MGDNRLSAQARKLIEDITNERYVSLVSIWEISIKTSLGKLIFHKPFDEVIPEHI